MRRLLSLSSALPFKSGYVKSMGSLFSTLDVSSHLISHVWQVMLLFSRWKLFSKLLHNNKHSEQSEVFFRCFYATEESRSNMVQVQFLQQVCPSFCQ